MIVYQLACAEGHFFEGWFASPAACEEQARAGQLQCPTCASVEVRKLPAAPHVHASGGSGASHAESDAVLRRRVLQALRTFILANTEDVGREFAEVARRIHHKEEEERGIRGHVTAGEAEKLREEGIETLTLVSEVLPGGKIH